MCFVQYSHIMKSEKLSFIVIVHLTFAFVPTYTFVQRVIKLTPRPLKVLVVGGVGVWAVCGGSDQMTSEQC